ncbi:MAG TPA: hypothetical protein PK977_16670 [Chitinophagaceae bacterium]|nr:hypothetical protein [Chitinophagaceae bacterium]
MKYFSLITILLVLATISTLQAFAQVSNKKTWNISVGADIIYPENNFRKTHGWGYGGTIKAEYLFEKHASIILSTGAYTLSGKTSLLNPDARTVLGIPVKAGLRYYLGNFYFGGDAGYLNQSGFESNNGFVYSFFIGDEIVTNKKNKNSLDLSIRHEAWVTDRTRAFASIRLAYEFRVR